MAGKSGAGVAMRLKRLIPVLLLIGGMAALGGCTPFEKWNKINRNTAKAFHEGHYQQSIVLAKQSLDLARTIFAKDQTYVDLAMNNLVFLYSVTGQYPEAESVLYQMLTADEMHLGPTHAQVGLLCLRLSELLRYEGQYSKAEAYGKRALSIISAQFPDHHPLLLEVMTNLAVINEAQGKTKDAEKLYQALLKLQEQRLGTRHPELNATLLSLENIYRRQGRLKDAIALATRRFHLLSATAPLMHAENYSQSLFNLASLYVQDQRFREARPLAEQLLAFDREYRGKLHPRVAQDLELLGSIFSSQRQWTQAAAMYRRALAIYRDHLPAEQQRFQSLHQRYQAVAVHLKSPQPSP